MITLNKNITSPIAFEGRINKKQKIESVRKAFFKSFAGLESPSKSKYLFVDNIDKSHFLDLNYKLLYVRNLLTQSVSKLSPAKFYKELINLTNAFKVANCHEYAILGNIFLQINKIKSDIFILCRKDETNHIHKLDHEIIAYNIPKSKNNDYAKKHQIPFKLENKMRIIDFWLDGKISNPQNAPKLYTHLGIFPNDEVYLMPIDNTFINKKSLSELKKALKKFLIKK